MIAIDTNVLVRIFVKDKDSQSQALLVQRLLQGVQTVYIPKVVQIELVWVLQSAYEYDKSSILKVLRLLDARSVFVLEDAHEFSCALSLFEQSNADFSDYLIVANCQQQDFKLWTFDRKLAKTDNVMRLV